MTLKPAWRRRSAILRGGASAGSPINCWDGERRIAQGLESCFQESGIFPLPPPPSLAGFLSGDCPDPAATVVRVSPSTSNTKRDWDQRRRFQAGAAKWAIAWLSLLGSSKNNINFDANYCGDLRALIAARNLPRNGAENMREQIVGGAFLLLLAGCSAVLPQETNVDSSKFQTYDQVLASYGDVQLGKTRLNELAGLGLDTRTTPNIEVLSYTDIVNRFLPGERMTLQQAPPAVRLCIEAQYRCSAYVFRLQNSHTQRSGGVVPDLLGFQQDTVNNGWSAEVVLLLQDDVVVYKVISGSPHTQDRRDMTQPLGPLQDMGKLIVGSPTDQNN